MAFPGKEVVNPKVGMRLKFIRTSKDTNAELLEMEAEYSPASKEPPPHYHPYQEEHFTVLEGVIQVRMNGRLATIKKGEELIVPEGTIHSMWNASSSITKLNWQVRPAMETEFLFETLHGLAADGKTNDDGVPGILQLSLTIPRFSKEFCAVNPPLVLQKIIFFLLSPIARVSGLKPAYSKYLN